MKVDYIIVGFGLAGLCFADKLRKENKSFVVFDDNSQDASLVAGGMYNPVILKRFTLAWEADVQLQNALSVYKDIETLLEESIITSKNILRRFNSVEEQNNWFTASDNNSLSPFLDTKLVASAKGINSEFSFGRVNGTGRLNTNKLISAYKAYLQSKKVFFTERFKYDLLVTNTNYKDIEFNHIVFSEGYGLHKNPLFKNLGLVGNKGEYITIKCEGLDLEEMLKFSLFIIPLGNHLYKVGATYSNQFKDNLPTDSAKKQIEAKLKQVLQVPYEVVKHEAGIRPTVKDRRPILGRHAEYSNFFINNGYGSRGIIIAPSAANWLYNFIENNQPLPKEVNVTRFF
ncbi:Glycine/D-amino acid oxidase [Mesonia phycicola]|uniref:Glycine/D-amino acid oxidase n=1 Tax=Mesonia phycicola TaxID=579105 RepID=A0A1M6EYG5_9FLAO|nr:FAD-binding oxidoreductase [Mesonia phycicola]SHI90507.1 Glycine/D-amino acid oxidase [Mesonia phycicola]